MSYSKATQYEAEGLYEEAAKEFALLGFGDLLDARFQPGRLTRIATSHLMQSVSCDMRGNNRQRAEWLSDIVRDLLEQTRDSSDDPVLTALCEEWKGDLELMMGNTNLAIKKYNKAAPVYRESDYEKCMSWGMEEEFDYAYWAFRRYIDSEGHELPDNSNTDFIERINVKKRITKDCRE